MRTSRHYTKGEVAWIERNYKRLDWYKMELEFHNQFGYWRCGKAIRRKGYNMGLRKMRDGINSSWISSNRVNRRSVKKCGGIVNYFLNGNV